MAVLDNMKLLAPTLTSAFTDGELNTFIGLAQNRIDACRWGNLYSDGIMYLALHIIQRANSGDSGGGAVGPVTQEMAGRVQISYAVPNDWSKNSLGSTPWGREFLDLRRKLGGTAFNTGFDSLCPPRVDGHEAQ